MGVALIAVNLRPALASVGPVLSEVRARLHLSSAAGSLLTTVPLVCFGLLAPLAPVLARRFGMERVLAVVLATIAAGLLLRVNFGPVGLFALTVPVACAIAIANVLVPALVKRDLPDRVGLMMGVYTMAMSGAAAVAAGVTAPLDHGLGWGWRVALAAWAVPALLALLVWLPRTPSRPPGPERVPEGGWGGLLRDPLAWQVTAFMGLQSLGFYATLTWLPSIYIERGYTAESAGLLLSVCAAVSAPVSLVVPTLAVRARDQRRLVAAAGVLPAAGFAGILLAPDSGAYLWALLLGVGQGALFALALTLVVLRSATSETAARLSAMSQAFGYLIAAGGPLLVGVVRDAAGGWGPAIALLLALLVPQVLTGLGAGRARHVGETG
ncbi:MAG: transporter, family, cyanate transporter [Micromonosporaceae bacterium]